MRSKAIVRRTKGPRKAKAIKKVVSKMLRNVVGRPEMKLFQTYDSAFTLTNDPTSAAAIIPPACPVRGNDVTTRVSDKIILRGWEIRIRLIGSSALQSSFLVRAMAMKWRNVDNATAPNPIQFLADVTAGIRSVLTGVAPVGSNCATDKGRKSFSVLKDKLLTMNGQEVTAPGSAISTAGGLPTARSFHWKFKFPQGIPVNFTGNTLSPSSILDNWVNFQLWSDTTPSCTAIIMQQIYWTDAA